jgi:hypothetical protein
VNQWNRDHRKPPIKAVARKDAGQTTGRATVVRNASVKDLKVGYHLQGLAMFATVHFALFTSIEAKP